MSDGTLLCQRQNKSVRTIGATYMTIKRKEDGRSPRRRRAKKLVAQRRNFQGAQSTRRSELPKAAGGLPPQPPLRVGCPQGYFQHGEGGGAQR
jgi:hypothetical protein